MRKHKSIEVLAVLAIVLAFMPEVVVLSLAGYDYLYLDQSVGAGWFHFSPQDMLKIFALAMLVVVVITSPFSLFCFATAYGLFRRRRWGWWFSAFLSGGTGLFVLLVSAACLLERQDKYFLIGFAVPWLVALAHSIVTHGSFWRSEVRREFQ